MDREERFGHSRAASSVFLYASSYRLPPKILPQIWKESAPPLLLLPALDNHARAGARIDREGVATSHRGYRAIPPSSRPRDRFSVPRSLAGTMGQMLRLSPNDSPGGRVNRDAMRGRI